MSNASPSRSALTRRRFLTVAPVMVGPSVALAAERGATALLPHVEAIAAHMDALAHGIGGESWHLKLCNGWAPHVGFRGGDVSGDVSHYPTETARDGRQFLNMRKLAVVYGSLGEEPTTYVLRD